MFSGVSTGTQIDVCKIPLYPPFKKGGFSYTQFLIPHVPWYYPSLKKRGQGRFAWVEGRIAHCDTTSDARNEVREGTVARSFVQITECLVGSDLASPNSGCRSFVRRGICNDTAGDQNGNCHLSQLG